MKPRDLFNMKPQEVTHDFSSLAGCYYNHITEVGDLHDFPSTTSERVTVNVIKHFDFDHRRFWRLCAVLFDGRPVMITRNAGREGDDHHSRFIVDKDRYMLMVEHIASLPRKPYPWHDSTSSDVVDIDAEIDGLDSFYNNSLSDTFERY